MGRRTVEELKHGKFTVDENGCHVWVGATQVSGPKQRQVLYGKVWDGVRYKGAHRAVMESFLGRALATEEFVCHKCDVPLCVNVDHLFVGTHQDNMDDMYSKKRGKGQNATHCKLGHPYAGENLLIDGKGNRRCKSCLKRTSAEAIISYRNRNAEKLRAKNREYHRLNKEKIRDRKRNNRRKQALLAAKEGGL